MLMKMLMRMLKEGVEYGVKTLIEFVQDIGYSKEDATTLVKQRFHLSDDAIKWNQTN